MKQKLLKKENLFIILLRNFVKKIIPVFFMIPVFYYKKIMIYLTEIYILIVEDLMKVLTFYIIHF